MANKRLSDHITAPEEFDFEQTIISQALQFKLLRSQIKITQKSDVVAQKRYVVSLNRYVIGKLDATNLNIGLSENNAKQSYVEALISFCSHILS
jgi:hypothetical protein